MATDSGKLTALAIKAAKIGKVFDGGGLYLQVGARGTQSRAVSVRMRFTRTGARAVGALRRVHVANAWQGEAPGFVKLPNALVDSEAFRALPDKGKLALLALSRQYNGANNGRPL